VLVLHGAGVDHREAEACFERALAGEGGLRRIYLDLPGMGRTPAPATLRSADGVLEMLLGFADEVTGGTAFLLIGHSASAYYAQAMAARRAEQVAVWRSSVRCCRERATSRSTASSPDRVRSVTMRSARTS
jgi:pimeloyl-ACP methyl ester carboxylesterase